MAKVQSRRSVSLSGQVYDRLRAHCARRGEPMSQVLEQLIEDALAPASTHARKLGAA